MLCLKYLTVFTCSLFFYIRNYQVNQNPSWGAHLKLSTSMKIFIGCMCEQGCILLSGYQSDSHDHSLTGLQKTCTEFGLSSSFYNCRNGHQVLPADTDR